jgi:hypothetical protein
MLFSLNSGLCVTKNGADHVRICPNKQLQSLSRFDANKWTSGHRDSESQENRSGIKLHPFQGIAEAFPGLIL